VKFYEGGFEGVPKDQRQYQSQFSVTDARYVWYDFYLTYARPGQRVDFAVESVWYRPDGSILDRSTYDYHINRDWTHSQHGAATGWRMPGRWAPGVYRVDLLIDGRKIAGGSFEIRGSNATYDVPSLNANVKSLRFFEGVTENLPVEQRKYQKRFSSSNARYIYWELYLTYEKQAQKKEFTIEGIWYRADGSEYARTPRNAVLPEGWDESLHQSGFGSNTPGTWPPGTYRVDLMIGGRKVASSAFEVLN
jgi:hypothetical protein